MCVPVCLSGFCEGPWIKCDERRERETGRGREAVCVSDSLEASHLAAPALSVCAQWPGSHVKVLSHSGMDHLTVSTAMSCFCTNSAERIYSTDTFD